MGMKVCRWKFKDIGDTQKNQGGHIVGQDPVPVWDCANSQNHREPWSLTSDWIWGSAQHQVRAKSELQSTCCPNVEPFMVPDI
jgi:hypothetical protein